jgi:hypothetical protein
MSTTSKAEAERAEKKPRHRTPEVVRGEGPLRADEEQAALVRKAKQV